jgi:hypothetical protein
MPREYCSLCRTVVNLSETVTPRTLVGKDGKIKTIITRTYHCDSCGSFVRSIDRDNNAVAI